MRFDQKNVLRGTLLIAMIGLVGALAFAQNDAGVSTSNKGLKVISAVGNATAAVATSCANIICPATHDCSFVTLTGTAKGFNRFGGSLGTGQMIACMSTDETQAVPNGNDGTLCAPSTGIAVIAGSSAGSTGNVSLNMAGQSCTVPGVSATGFQVFNDTWVITSSTSSKAGRGSGSFNAFANTGTGDGSFTVAGNFSAASATVGPSSTPTSTASSSGSPTASGSPSPSASPT